MTIPVAMTIAGSDSGGGAGLQADLKAFAALGVHGVTAVTALTAQNTTRVDEIWPVDPYFVGRQIDMLCADFAVAAVKTGMLGSRGVVEMVADRVRAHGLPSLVVDPVLRATTGAALLDPDALTALRTLLLPLARVVTPNLAEAEALCGFPVATLADMRRAALALHGIGAATVVVKGGHLPGAAIDVLFDGDMFAEFSSSRLAVSHSHGTGCTFASGIAAGLALGQSVASAVQGAKDLVTKAIRDGHDLGSGAGPVDALAYLRAGRTPR